MQNALAPRPTELANSNLPLLTTLLVVDSLHFVFARLLLPHIQPEVSAMYVMAVATVEVGLFGLFQRRLHIRVLGRHLWFFLSIGILVGANTVIGYQSVAYIDPGTASLLGQTSILFSVVLGLFWLRDRLAPPQIAGAVLALGGIFTIAFQPGDYLRTGSVMVLSASLMYALHAAIVKRSGGQIEFLDFFFFRLLATTSFLLIFALGRQVLVWPSNTVWQLLILIGTVDVVISRTLYYIALRRLQISIHAVVLTLSPVATILWTLLLFGVVPTLQQMVGGAAVMAGVVIVTLKQNR
jgi:drug/metabolite transporter (DMT)-like permease